MLRNVNRAMQLLEVAREGGNQDAAFNLGVLCLEQGDLRKAGEFYEEARRGGNMEAAVNLGALYQKQGDLQKAREFVVVVVADVVAQKLVSFVTQLTEASASFQDWFAGARGELGDRIRWTAGLHAAVCEAMEQLMRSPPQTVEAWDSY